MLLVLLLLLMFEFDVCRLISHQIDFVVFCSVAVAVAIVVVVVVAYVV